MVHPSHPNDSLAALLELGVSVSRAPGGDIEEALDTKRRAEQLVDTIRSRCHPLAYDLLRDTACFGKYLGRRDQNPFGYIRLGEALDVGVEVFGVPEYRD